MGSGDQVGADRGTDEAVNQLRADYDATPYVSDSFPQSAPGQLAATAYLFGLETPPVTRARVLEIGCAAGGNVIPFAAAHPEASVVGIDLSGVQIEQGRRRSQAAGLDNLQLVEGDIARMDLSALGQFDFIIAHGVYSWVPENVQDAILSAFNSLLAPEGVAYISYNVYPGWKSKEIVRDAMLLASRSSATPDEKVRSARRMVDFLEEVAPDHTPLASAVAEFRSRDYGFGVRTCCTTNSRSLTCHAISSTCWSVQARTVWRISRRRGPRSCSRGITVPRWPSMCSRNAGALRCSSNSIWTSSSIARSANRYSYMPNAHRRFATAWTEAVTAVCISLQVCRRPMGRHGSISHVRGIFRRAARRCSPTIRASRRHSMRSPPAGRGRCHARSC